MRNIFWILSGVLIALTGCSEESGRKPVLPVNTALFEKTLTIVNADAVDSALLERVRTFAEKELHVPVRVVENPGLAGEKDFQSLENAAAQAKQENDVSFIVVANLEGEDHLKVNADHGIALINARALYAGERDLFEGRIRRMVMRAAAFSFGLEPTPDPYCVTRDYRSLEDLDRMGNNYSPPWQIRYAREAVARGLQILNPSVDTKPAPGSEASGAGN